MPDNKAPSLKVNELRVLGTWLVYYGNLLKFSNNFLEGDEKKQAGFIADFIVALGFSLITLANTVDLQLQNQDKAGQDLTNLKKNYEHLNYQYKELVEVQQQQQKLLEELQQQNKILQEKLSKLTTSKPYPS